MSDEGVDIRFIGRQLESMNNRLRSMRDDLAVMTAIATRLDGKIGRLNDELRTNRIQALEGAATDEASP